MQEEDLEEVLIKALIIHNLDMDVTKAICLELMDNIDGQKMLIEYLANTKNITVEEIWIKTKEISRITAESKTI